MGKNSSIAILPIIEKIAKILKVNQELRGKVEIDSLSFFNSVNDQRVSSDYPDNHDCRKITKFSKFEHKLHKYWKRIPNINTRSIFFSQCCLCYARSAFFLYVWNFSLLDFLAKNPQKSLHQHNIFIRLHRPTERKT